MIARTSARAISNSTDSSSATQGRTSSDTKRKKLPQYPLPVLRLARLAVDGRAQGRGIGSALLRAVFLLAHRMSEEFGCTGVVVDAKPEAIPFYEKLGFIDLDTRSGQLGDRPEPRPMFLELGAIPKPSEL
jgi:predicted N-acetyltransferase YhbS